MNNFTFIIFIVLWIVVIAQGFIIFTFTKEIERFSSKIVGIRSGNSQQDHES